MPQPALPKIELPTNILKVLKENEKISDLKIRLGLAFLLLSIVFIAITYWKISLALAIVALGTYAVIQKAAADRYLRVTKSDVLFVPEHKTYIIPIKIVDRTITSIQARLKNGSVELIESSYQFDRVKEVDRDNIGSNRDLEIAKQISYSIQTMYQIEPKIGEFKQRIEEIKHLKNLASRSEVYAQKVVDYSQLILQIEETIENAKQLRNECFKLIGEILIGAELAKFDPDKMSDPMDWKSQFATRYNAITEQFQFLQDKEKAYSELRQ
jgi:uncharacterized membrane protein